MRFSERFSRKVLLVAGLVAAGAAGAAYAGVSGGNGEVLELLKARLPNTEVTSVDCSRVGGLCEVLAGANLFYTDRTARYLIIGRVYDMDTRQDLTAARLLEVNPSMLVGGAARASVAGEETAAEPVAAAPVKVSLDELPESGAIAWGRGGPTVTVFSDLRCPYCRMLHNDLRRMNVRVVERPISILGTRLLSNAVMCADDRRRALMSAYAGEDMSNAGTCDTSGLDANERFARDNGFGGTPVIVRADGAVLHGYRSKDFLEAWLKEGKS